MVNMKEISSEGTANNLKRILKGAAIAMGITLILLLLYSVLLTYTNINENTIPVIIIIITAVSILTGSLMSSLSIKKNGLTNGILVAIIYIMLIYLLSSIIKRDFGLTIYSIIMIFVSAVSGAIGGVVGVNR